MKRFTLPLGLIFIMMLLVASACESDLPITPTTEAPHTQPAPVTSLRRLNSN